MELNSGLFLNAAVMSAAQTRILDEIAMHAQKTVALKVSLNALVPICRLPHEILSEIFIALVRCDHNNPCIRRSCLRWIEVAHVCHRWREVALASPGFWSFIRVSNPEILSQLVARSKDCPLHVDLHEGHCNFNVTTLDILSRHIHRAQELSMKATAETIRALFKKVDGTKRFLHLQSLDLSTEKSRHMSYHRPKPLPSPMHFSQTLDLTARLRHLTLECLPF